MTKSDLEDGMIVELRSGGRYMFISKIDLFISETFGYNVVSFNGDLTYRRDERCDVMKVFKPVKNGRFSDILSKSDELIWERKGNTLTKEQIEKLKALNTLGFNWIARDEEGNLLAYNLKPVKFDNCWFRNNNDDVYMLGLSALGLDVPFIKKEEDEPTNINDLLKWVE